VSKINGSRERKAQSEQISAARYALLAVCFALPFVLMGCNPQRFFYYPNRHLYADPDKTGLHPELVQYLSLNGKMLTALYFKTSQPPKGTIVHFHGNFGNVSNHFPLSLFLLKYGFDVLAFDYEGYGASEGKPSPKNIVNDGIASVRYAYDHRRDPATGVAVFGQSLGGATAIVVTAKEPLVKGAVIEAAFTGHAAMVRAALGRHIITWPLYPFAPFFVNHSLDPIKFVAQISPRPVFFIHGDADEIVPVAMSKELYEKAKEPKKLWIVPGAGHLEAHRIANTQYETAVADFFTTVLSTGTRPN
jgi:fermentation-respiration switch protein FrsA (DUF1100 family)